MIIYLMALLFVSVGFIFACMFRETMWSKKQFWTYLGKTTATFLLAATVLLTITRLASYKSYVTTRTQYDAIVNQYKGAVVLYTNYATLDIGKIALTDLKYHNYQNNTASLITDLRKEVISYNDLLISKRTMKKNVLMSWMIQPPDKDMKIINIVE